MKTELTAKQVIKSLAARTKKPTSIEITIYTGHLNHVVILQGGRITSTVTSMKDYKGVMFYQPNDKTYTFSLKYNSINNGSIEDSGMYIFIKGLK